MELRNQPKVGSGTPHCWERLARIPALSIVAPWSWRANLNAGFLYFTQGEASLPHKNPTAFLVMAGDGVFQENVRIRTCSRLLSATADTT